MQAKDIMTRDIISVSPETTLAAAIGLMLDKHVSGLPVIDANGSLAGVLTEGDLLRRIETGTERERPHWLEFIIGTGRAAEDYVRSRSRQVGDLMTIEVVTATEDASLNDLVTLMEDKHIKRVPILRGATVVGIVSRSDLLRVLSRALRNASAGGPVTDADIREQIVAEVKKQDWAPAGSVAVEVTNGIAVLSGVIFDDRDRAALRVTAENVPGVKAVRDELTWVEPNTGTVIEAQ